MIYNFKDDEYQRVSPILECECRNPHCNGRYIQCYKEQKTCLWSFWEYMDNSLGEIKMTWYNKETISNNQTMIYTPEQQEEINERVKRALVYLESEQLTPSAYLSHEKIDVEGKDIFGTRVQPYLQDTRYKDENTTTS